MGRAHPPDPVDLRQIREANEDSLFDGLSIGLPEAQDGENLNFSRRLECEVRHRITSFRTLFQS